MVRMGKRTSGRRKGGGRGYRECVVKRGCGRYTECVGKGVSG